MPEAPHISMIRSYTWADVLTIGNASCGTIAIFLCLDYLATGKRRFLWAAFILLPTRWCATSRRLRRPLEQETAVGARRRSRFARGRDLVWGRAGGTGLHARPARRVGHGHPDLLRGVRRQPSRALQRHVGGAGRRNHGQGEILRRHADPDEHRHRAVTRRRAVARTRRRQPVVRRLSRSAPRSCIRSALIYGASGSAMISATLRIPKP